MEPPASPARAPRRIVSAASSGASPNPFSRSAATGTSTASTNALACARASSRVTRPSSRPRVLAMAPLEVAMAGKPSPASTRALPASQALAITKMPLAWSSRKRATRSGPVIAELLEGRQAVAEAHPAEVVGKPRVMRGRERVGVVQAAGGHVDRVRRIRVAVGDGRAAVAAERARHRRSGMERGRRAFQEAEAPDREGDPGHHGRGGNAPAGTAMADHGVGRVALGRIADRPADAAAFGGRAHLPSAVLMIRTAISARQAMTFWVRWLMDSPAAI